MDRNCRDEVWGYNVVPLYEEAKTRQWNATTDVTWRELDRQEIPLEIETTFCQLCTFDEYFVRCDRAGLGERRSKSELASFLNCLS